MGRKSKKQDRTTSPQPRKRPSGPLRRVALLLVLGLLAAVGVLLVISNSNHKTTPPPVTRYAQRAKTLDGLLKMTPEQLAEVDVAEMNLLCATGLPGADRLNIGRCLARLDKWAQQVKVVTGRHLYRAHDPKYAEHYKHSETWLRSEFLAQVLQEDCGVHYNMERVRNIDFTNAKDLFIHGMIDDANGGTCVSMPVLYVAVGRRLGYPLWLVLTKGHVFARWEAGTERFNIETTSTGGTDSYPDEHYKTWPLEWTEAEKTADCYLKSLSPAEELACFLGSRGHCLLDTGRAGEAFETYAAAQRLAPSDPAYSGWMRTVAIRLHGRHFAIGPEGIPEPPKVYRADRLEAELRRVEAINAYNRRLMQRDARRLGIPPPYAPQPARPYAPQAPSPYRRRPRIPGQPKVPGQP